MMGNLDPEAEAKEDQPYEVLVNRELPIVTNPDGPPLGEGPHVMKQNSVHLRHMPQVGTKDHINS